MNMPPHRQLIDLWHTCNQDVNWFAREVFKLGVAQGEANQAAVQEKAERIEQMLLDKPSILASSTPIRAWSKA